LKNAARYSTIAFHIENEAYMQHDKILLAHGGGGILTRELIETVIVPAFGTSPKGLPDAAPVPGADNLLLTTDSFVVKPLFFPGGDIGSLSIHGTVNDLAVSGARPLAIALSLIIEEGLPVETLKHVVESAARAARECGVGVVTGDTKVVARTEADGLFITTAGVGLRMIATDPRSITAGDAVIISGAIAEHGIAVMSKREGIDFRTEVVSDSASVWPLVEALIKAGIAVRVMRDPTRGGLAATLTELAADGGVTVRLVEDAIPINGGVAAACEMLGIDPLTVANEGKLVAIVAEKDAQRAVKLLREVSRGEEAAVIGSVVPRGPVPVTIQTGFGSVRAVDMPYGEELPRIC
jgi:hydrogenase expression/formation protein HypE